MRLEEGVMMGIFILLLLVLLLILSNLSSITLCFLPQIIQGVFILLAAVVTATFAIHKYQSEQRTLRLQKVYFEDTLLGQAKSIEGMMSQTYKNRLLTENLYNLTINILNQHEVQLETIKTELIAIFDNTLTHIGLDFFTTDFKKETISKLLHDSGIKKNVLPIWISQFEVDSYRFSAFLQDQILVLKMQANRLTESNKESYLRVIRKILGDYVQQNYFLVERHVLLFNLLSEIVLEFSSEHYTSFKKIVAAFKKERMKKIVGLLNTSYEDTINNFKSIDIGNIKKEDSIRLDEKIKCTREKISKELYNN
ncbi:TPA: hypothetical protein F8R96_09645 [Legionella pneumophila]|nr:hypothetical protein [Legionella pneumophila]HBI2946828.1 hypothetical protein [Legionella pneumophila]